MKDQYLKLRGYFYAAKHPDFSYSAIGHLWNLGAKIQVSQIYEQINHSDTSAQPSHTPSIGTHINRVA